MRKLACACDFLDDPENHLKIKGCESTLDLNLKRTNCHLKVGSVLHALQVPCEPLPLPPRCPEVQIDLGVPAADICRLAALAHDATVDCLLQKRSNELPAD